MLVSDIIQQLNQAPFPAVDIWYPIDTRLSVYRDEKHWAMVIELFVFNDRTFGHGCPCTMLHCYGDDLPQAPGLSEPLLVLTSDGPSGPLFDPKDPIQQRISPSAKDIRIRDRVIPVTIDPTDYAAAGIELSDPPRVQGYELFRWLVCDHNRLFFSTDAEIADHLGRSMPLLLRLDEWHHPEVDEEPYESESFQMIADVIAHNDPSLYQPTEPPNTHWSNWPNAPAV